jgi:ribosomal protein L37AE/L43A
MDNHLAYKKLVDAFTARSLTERTEMHHIVPRSLGGGNEPTNIVRLTPKAHFVAHRLLARIHGGKMWAALAYMSRRNTKSACGVKVTSRTYDLIAREDAAWRSEYYTQNNPFKGKKHSQEALAMMRGPRPSVSGENNARYGKKNSEVGAVISFVQTYRPRAVAVDLTLRNQIDRDLVDPSKELKALNTKYRKRVSGMAGAYDTRGRKNPNFGNGAKIAGDKNPMFGKSQSHETKAKISEKAKRQAQCPNCGKLGSVSNMKRWHFDNCKHQNNSPAATPV